MPVKRTLYLRETLMPDGGIHFSHLICPYSHFITFSFLLDDSTVVKATIVFSGQVLLIRNLLPSIFLGTSKKPRMIPNREAVLDKSLWHWFMAGDAMSLTVATALLLVFFACYKHSFDVRCASNIPRVRDFGNNRFSLRTRLSYFTDCQQLYREAYEKVYNNFIHKLVQELNRCVVFQERNDLPRSWPWN